MSSELERRLEAMLAGAPEPEAGAGEEALHRALRALHPAAPPRRGLRAAVLAFAAAVVLLVIAAGSLGAAGALHVSFGTKPKPKPRPEAKPLTLLKGAEGIAAVVGGRLSLVTAGGLRLQARASAAALSPHAVYVAVGIGRSLVAMAPSGRLAWTHPAGGRVVAVAWAPDAIRIAYVVRAGHRFVLHVIWGTGTHDTVIDRGVRPVPPSWRADSLALAYVGAGGKAIVYDLGHRTHTVPSSAAPIVRLAFGSAGRTLVLATPSAMLLGRKTVVRGEIEAVGWLHGHPAVALEQGSAGSLVRTFSRSGGPLEGFRVPGRVLGLTGGLVVTRTHDKVLAGWRGKTVGTILEVRPATRVDDVSIG
ncbi:MAG TPA: hypothetical protein VE985_11990 [Gaiellaceae bacterium]|nr:hypothetical protein [Gaiellaceae bacterium]